jgi:hypothetical protein
MITIDNYWHLIKDFEIPTIPNVYLPIKRSFKNALACLLGLDQLRFSGTCNGMVIVEILNNWNNTARVILPLMEIAVRARLLMLFPAIFDFSPI